MDTGRVKMVEDNLPDGGDVPSDDGDYEAVSVNRVFVYDGSEFVERNPQLYKDGAFEELQLKRFEKK